jgi:hypothetical protein
MGTSACASVDLTTYLLGNFLRQYRHLGLHPLTLFSSWRRESVPGPALSPTLRWHPVISRYTLTLMFKE